MAAVFATAPLLPQGLVHVGWAPRGYVELVLPALLLIWIVQRCTRPSAPALSVRVALWPWDLMAAVAIGSTIHALMADNHVWSPVFAARLRSDFSDLFRPISQGTHPLYSLRVALTFLEGWAVFRVTLALCRRAGDPGLRARTALAGWLTGLVATAAFALFQYVTRFNLHAYWVKANPSLVRAHSTLDDPNALGAVLVLGLGLTIGLWRAGIGRRWTWGVLGSTFALALVSTMSRAAMGAVLLAVLIVAAFMPGSRASQAGRVGWGTLAARAGLGILLMAVITSVVARGFMSDNRRTNPENPVDVILKTFDPRESNGWVLRGRLPWWQAGAAMFSEHPAFGVGLGRYPRLMGGYGGGAWRENTHNLYLQLLAETGIPGFLALMLLATAVCVGLIRGALSQHDPLQRAIAYGGLIGVAAFLLTLLTGHTLLLASGQILWASFVALVLVIAAMPDPSAAPLSGRSHRLRASVLVCAVFMAPVAAVARGVEPRTGAWGDHWGLYDVERADDAPSYRWTKGHARLELDVPERAVGVVLRMTAVAPIRGGEPTVARVTVASRTTEVVFTDGTPQEVRVPLLPVRGRFPRHVSVEISVHPTLVPSAVFDSYDSRVLGVQLLSPVFVFEDDEES